MRGGKDRINNVFRAQVKGSCQISCVGSFPVLIQQSSDIQIWRRNREGMGERTSWGRRAPCPAVVGVDDCEKPCVL